MQVFCKGRTSVGYGKEGLDLEGLRDHFLLTFYLILCLNINGTKMAMGRSYESP
jgi:hypothetical protein